jgi:DNA-directed RNA polymerase specialized sigma24 family protein
MVEAIARIDPDRVSRTAATLLRNVERDLTRARLGESRIEAGRTDLDPERIPAEAAASLFGLPVGLDADAACAALAARLRPTLGRDADLVVALAAAGARRAEVAGALGLPIETVKKRGQRALARLRAEVRAAA